MPLPSAVHAQTVNSASQLRAALNTSATPGTTSATITLGSGISLAGYSAPGYNSGAGFLGAINAPTGGAVLTIEGNGNALTGGSNALFFASPENETSGGGVSNPTAQQVTIENLTISGAISRGGNGLFGGGGAGLGGGLFVGTGVNLTLNGVNFTGNHATGGSSITSPGYGGGGLGGTSGEFGGGGLYANGGNTTGGGSSPGGFGGGGNYYAGSGGFGGGGAYGGHGGFGGAGGYNNSGGFGGGGGYNGSGGVAGGNGSYGGGAGLGGAIFLQKGATLTLTGSDTLAGDVATGGGGSHAGAGVGSEIFMMTGASLTLAPGTGNVVTIGAAGDSGDDIADDSAASLPSGHSYGAGSAAGAALVLGSSAEQGGTVYLYGNNTYAGGTTLQDGVTLVVGNSHALGTGAITMMDPTMVYANGDNLANAITLMGATTLEVDNTDSATQSGVISESGGSQAITKAGTGTLVLTNANTYTGGTTINAGILQGQNASSFGTGTITVASGGTLELVNGITIANDVTIGGSGSAGQGAIHALDSASYVITETVAGTVTLATDAAVGADNLESDLVLEAVNLQSHTLSTSGAGGVYLEGAISGSGGLTLGAAEGTYFTGSQNSFTGTTDVLSGTFATLSGTEGPTISGDLTIEDTAGVNDTRGGQFASTTTVTLNGAGQLIFFAFGSTAETFAGLDGTSNASLVSSIFIGSGATTLTVTGTGTYSYAGQIQGNDQASIGLIKQGSGSQELDGNNSYSGGTTLTDGTLIAGNSSAFGTGLLQVSNGTLKMGNNNHVLAVGSYAQTGGTLYLNLTGNGQTATADLLHITNSAISQAVLGGTLEINLAGFTVPAPTPGPAKTYTFAVVAADSGYTGTFLVDPIDVGAGLTPRLVYSPDDVFLEIVQRAVTFATIDLTRNQQAVLHSVNAGLVVGNATPNFAALITALTPYTANPAAFGAVLDQLSPLEFGRFTSVTAFNNASFETEAMDNYLAGHRVGPNGTFAAGNGNIDASGLTVNDPSYDPNLAMVHSRLLAWNPAPYSGSISDVANPLLGGVDLKDAKDTKSMASPASTEPWNLFVRGSVILAQGFSDSDVSHFDENTSSVVLGTDYRLTPNLLVGLTAGYGHTDVTLDDNGSSATVDSYSPGLYASYANQGWYANLTGDYVHNAYTQSRVIGFLGQTANSAPEGNEGVANLDGGCDLHHGALTFGPVAGLQYTHLTVDGYNEGGSIADLSVHDDQSDSLRSRLGGRLSYAFSHDGVNFTPHLDATWQHEFMDQSRGVTSQFEGTGLGSFSVRTQNPSRDSALADLGLDADINRTVTAFADYELQAGQQNYFGQSVQAGVKIGF